VKQLFLKPDLQAFGVTAVYGLRVLAAGFHLQNSQVDSSNDAMREALDQQMVLVTALVFGGVTLLSGVALRWSGSDALPPEARTWVRRLVLLLAFPSLGLWLIQ
jgi:uncharacterized membrane protein